MAVTKEPLVSIVVCTYKQETTIAQTLDSLLAQEIDFPIEIIIGEDNSTDGTRAICERYVAQHSNIIRLMPQSPNKGFLRNYRDCVGECKGKYLAGCSGDDYWNGTQYLAQKIAFMEANPQYGVLHTDHDILHVATNMIEKSHRKARNQKLHSEDNIFVELMGRHPSGIAGLTAVIRLDLMRLYVDLNHYIEKGFLMEDLPMWLDLSQHTLFKYMDISSATYRIADGSACNNSSDLAKNEQFYKNSMNVRLYYTELYPQYNIDQQDIRNQFYEQMVYASFKGGDNSMLKKYLKLWKPNDQKDSIKKLIICTPLLSSMYRNRLNKNYNAI